MLIKDVFLKILKAAAFAPAVCVLLSGCGGGQSGGAASGYPTGPSLDGDLVGDWLVYEGGNKIRYISLKSSGELSAGVFQKVSSKGGNFWVEGLYEGSARWGAARELGEFYVTSAVWSDTSRYEFSGNFNTTACYDNSDRGLICKTSELTRTNLADLKSTLGKVYDNNDRSLYMSTTHSDLMWYLQGNTSEYIDFDAVYFNKGGERAGNTRDGVWYTTGDSRLFLLDVAYDCGSDEDDCGVTVQNTVELGYSVTSNGGAPARLTLSGSGFGAGDVWQPASYDDRTGYGAAKSRQGANGRKRVLSPLPVLTGGR
jgi:hypothetical protein